MRNVGGLRTFNPKLKDSAGGELRTFNPKLKDSAGGEVNNYPSFHVILDSKVYGRQKRGVKILCVAAELKNRGQNSMRGPKKGVNILWVTEK